MGAGLVTGLTLTLSGVPAHADFQTDFLAAVNEYRATGTTCPGVTGTGAPLEPNILLNAAATMFAEALVEGKATPEDSLRFTRETGYVHWRVTGGMVQTRLREPTGSFVARTHVGEETTCRNLLAPDLSEIGVATFIGADATTFVFIAARPFRRDRLATYRQEFVDHINAMREAGATCFGVAMPPQPPVLPSPDLNKAAQAHSDDMASAESNPPDPLIGQDGSNTEQRFEATGCDGRNLTETVMPNATDPERTLLSMTGPYGIATPEQCHAILATAPHLGIGLAQPAERAASEAGRGPWLTITTAQLDERCAARAEAAVTSETATVEFDPDTDYRITNAGLQMPLVLSAQSTKREVTEGRQNAAFLDTPSLDRAQRWRLSATSESEGSKAPAYTLTSGYRGKGLNLTATTGENPFSLTKAADQDASEFARASQHWSFDPVAGMPDTYMITNSGRKGIYLAATPGGHLTFTETGFGNVLAYWRVVPDS